MKGDYRIKPAGGAMLRLAALAHAVTTPDVSSQLYLIPRGETPAAQRASRRARLRFSKPGAREAHAAKEKEIWSDKDRLERRSVKIRRAVQSPRYRRKMAKKVWGNPEVRAVQSEKAKSLWKSPGFQAKITKARLVQWADPAYRARMLEVLAKARAKKLRRIS
jgi:hypothetical protein